uniref:CSON004020 protein n=1 Tax=Culicoides sonorensis TaxID=179676 RepID=A0A336KAG2_CULSO
MGDHNSDIMDFDSILDEIGEFGKFQFTNYMLVCLPVFFAAANSLSYVFTAAIPNYRCLVPDCDTDTEYYEDWVSIAVPGKTIKDNFVPLQCQRYQRNYSVIAPEWGAECNKEMFTTEIERCSEWIFDEGERTIVNDVGTAHFAGIVVGSGAFGVLADKYGRKLIFIVCTVIMSITGVIQALSTNYEIFTLFGFLNAVGTSGVFPLAFIIGVEMVGKTKRDITGIVLNYFYALGEAAVGLIAWLCQDWVSIQLIVSAPPIVFIIYYWMIPESVRWLLAKKRNRKAEKIVKKAAKVNGVQLSDNILSTFEDSPNDSDNNLLQTPLKTQKVKPDMWEMIKEVFRSKVMIVRGLILFYNWATCAFVFYGLSLNSVNLIGNKYLNFTLVSLIEIPGYSMAWYAMNKIGRRLSLSGSLFLCGITCIGGAFVSEEAAWLTIILFLIGKMGITSSFGVIYVYSAEMLPTLIRSGGVGSMSTFARLGALIAPFVPLLNYIHPAIPLLLFGLVSVIGGFFILFLPETMGRKLPDTVAEAENLSENKLVRDVEMNNSNTPKR